LNVADRPKVIVCAGRRGRILNGNAERLESGRLLDCPSGSASKTDFLAPVGV
jgi:hypothetical protein